VYPKNPPGFWVFWARTRVSEPWCGLLVCVCGLRVVNPCVLTDLPVRYQRKITARLPTSVPLHVTAALIDASDSDYWRRCCRARYTAPADVQHYGASWKRMMLEKTIENIIENYVPVPAHCARLQAGSLTETTTNIELKLHIQEI